MPDIRRRYMSVEQPNDHVVIDFLGTGARGVKRRRACKVDLRVADGQLHVRVQGCDDRATILLDQVVDLPEEDRRR